MKTNCNHIRGQLSAYVDNETSPAERAAIERHLGGCSHCRRELEQLKMLAAGVTALPRLQPAPQFLADVRRKIAREGKPVRSTWWDYLFRPVWLKVPLEAIAALAIVALVMRLEWAPTQRSTASLAAGSVGKASRSAPAVPGSQLMDRRIPRLAVDGAMNEASRPAVAPAPAEVASLESASSLPAQSLGRTVVVHASNFDKVRNQARELASALDGALISSNEPGTASGLYVELPQENVAAFESRLLHAAGSGLGGGEAGSVSGGAPRSAAVIPAVPGILVGGPGTNQAVGREVDRSRTATIQKNAAKAIVEIQVRPPAN